MCTEPLSSEEPPPLHQGEFQAPLQGAIAPAEQNTGEGSAKCHSPILEVCRAHGNKVLERGREGQDGWGHCLMQGQVSPVDVQFYVVTIDTTGFCRIWINSQYFSLLSSLILLNHSSSPPIQLLNCGEHMKIACREWNGLTATEIKMGCSFWFIAWHHAFSLPLFSLLSSLIASLRIWLL